MHRNRPVLSLLLGVSLTLGAMAITAGCASSPTDDVTSPAPVAAVEPAPQSTDDVTTAIPEEDLDEVFAQDDISDDQLFVSAVRATLALGEEVADSDLVETGHLVCGALEEGNAAEDVLSVMVNPDFTYFEAGFVLGASVAAYCPAYTDDVSALAA